MTSAPRSVRNSRGNVNVGTTRKGDIYTQEEAGRYEGGQQNRSHPDARPPTTALWVLRTPQQSESTKTPRLTGSHLEGR
jgi:hypothetical protein